LKTTPDDFRVAEVAAVPPDAGRDASAYTYFTVSKSGISTFDVAGRLAATLDVPESDVEWLGLKDEDGITTQVFSARRILDRADLDRLAPALDANVRPHWARMAGIVGYGSDPLSRRCLIGNTFHIAVRGLSEVGAEGVVAALAGSRTVPFINYYDSQRFGVIGSDVLNTHEVGAAIERRDFATAYEAFLASGNSDQVKAALRDAYADTADHGRAMLSVGRRLTQFMVDAAASYRWNEALSAELERSGSVEHLDAIPGVQRLAFCPVDERRVPVVVSAPGGRVLDPDDDGWVVEPQPYRRPGVQQAYLISAEAATEPDGDPAVRLAFYLPRGCYATMFVRYVLWLGGNH
jgi:tRNA pseudouridine13 synthase